MSNILIVSQKELIKDPIFKQDKNLVEMCNILKNGNNVKILYLHKNLSIDVDKNKNIQNNNLDNINIEQYSIKDMMKGFLFKKNILKFLKDNNIDTIIFMTCNLARLIIPLIETITDRFNIICDFRLSQILHVLKEYKEEIAKDYSSNLQRIYKSFKVNFLCYVSIIKNSDYLIFDTDTDIRLLEKENVNNIITIKDVQNCLKISKNKNLNKKFTMTSISINKNNFCAQNIIPVIKNNDEYNINENKDFNLIDTINDIIRNNNTEYFCIYSNKIKKLQNTFKQIVCSLSFNSKMMIASPEIIYSRDVASFNIQAENQRNGNFSNWEETKPMSFSDFVVIKKEAFKIGFFDNNFKTFEYALFDFILKLYQNKLYYLKMKDISVYKYISVDRQNSLLQEDKVYLCNKWGESAFNMGI